MYFHFTVIGLNKKVEMLVFVEGGKPEYPKKNPQSKYEVKKKQRNKIYMQTVAKLSNAIYKPQPPL